MLYAGAASVSGAVTFFSCVQRYELRLDHDRSWWGYMSCKMTGTFVGKKLRATAKVVS